jgi:hypothetical protein
MGSTPFCTPWETIWVVTLTATSDAGDRRDLFLELGAQLGMVALGRVAQHHVHGDLAAVDADVLDAARGHQVLLQIGVHVFLEA